MSGKTFSVNNAAAAAVPFTPTVLLPDGQQYVDAATALTEPRFAVVKHTMASSSSNTGIDRHYVQFQKTRYDALGKAQTVSIGISVVVPRSTVTAADLADIKAFAKNLLGDSTIMGGLVLGDY
jgi:hypothetical protein